MDKRAPSYQAVDEGNSRAQRTNNSSTRKNKPGRKQQRQEDLDGLNIAETIPLALHHFFPGFNTQLQEIPDFRDEDKSTYASTHLIHMGILMFLLHCGSRCQLRKDRKTKPFKQNLLALSDSNEDFVADPDTMNYFLEGLVSDHLATVPCWMVKQLLAKRALESFRLFGDYKIAIDATKIFSFKERHCPHCTKIEHSTGEITYFHYVLEAKLIAGDFAFSIASEFIENHGEIFDKQDCELKAAYRLLPRIKKLFPRLKICLLADGLYLNQNIIAICEEYGWSYIITFKEGSAKTVMEKSLMRLSEQTSHQASRKSKGGYQDVQWATGVDFKGHTIHALFSKGEEGGVPKKFIYATDLFPTRENIFELINEGGRTRWKIENEGFNTQKNDGFALAHPYGMKGNAWKNYYFLLQIAHILLQIITESDLFRKLSKQHLQKLGLAMHAARDKAAAGARSLREHCGSLKNLSLRLLEAIRGIVFSGDSRETAKEIQVRFNTS